MQADYEFATQDGGKTYTRKLFGIEQLVAVMSSKVPGFGSLTSGFVVNFPTSASSDAIRKPVEAAWARLRSNAPLVAYKTKDRGNPESSLYLEYTVPSGEEAVKKWTEETIHWHQDKMSLRERDVALKNAWWKASEGRYNYELHVAPDVEDGKWQILLNAGHWSSDVRGQLYLCEMLFTYLNEFLVESTPITTIQWGTETAKLTPPGAIAAALAAGVPTSTLFPKPPVPAPSAETSDSQANSEAAAEQKQDAPPAPPAGPVLFLRPTPVVDAEPKLDATAYDLWLTAEESAKVRAACKKHGVTVTQLISALMIVSEVEWAITYTEAQSDEEKKQSVETYEKATHVPCLWNVVDQRHKLKEYARHDGAKGSPPFGAEGFPLMFDMAAVRKAVKYNKETGKVERDTSDAVFWNSVVNMCKGLWKSSDMALTAYMEREIMCQMYSSMFEASSYQIPALLNSSVGDLEGLGLLTAFSPAVPSNKAQRLLLEQVSISVRCPTPTKMFLAWQWNNRILIRPQTAAKWTSEKGLQAQCAVMKAWVDAVCN